MRPTRLWTVEAIVYTCMTAGCVHLLSHKRGTDQWLPALYIAKRLRLLEAWRSIRGLRCAHMRNVKPNL
eukprot:7834668-Pyramimonas_sp.AAC.1